MPVEDPDDASKLGAGERMMPSPVARRFAVALSFPGEARRRVATIAQHLAAQFGGHRVLYDKLHEAEFARPNLDVYLQGLYHDHAELNVVFLGKNYEAKEWCGLEWRAIRDLIKHRRQEIMLLRLDDGPVSGVFSIDGYIDISTRDDIDVALVIRQRWTQQQESQPPSPTTPATTSLIKDSSTLARGTTALCDLHFDKGDRIRVVLEAAHEIDFAICTPAVYKRWRATARLTGCLYHARRTSNMTIAIVANDPGTPTMSSSSTTRDESTPYPMRSPWTSCRPMHGGP